MVSKYVFRPLFNSINKYNQQPGFALGSDRLRPATKIRDLTVQAVSRVNRGPFPHDAAVEPALVLR
jgi:hypothetical protein